MPRSPEQTIAERRPRGRGDHEGIRASCGAPRRAGTAHPARPARGGARTRAPRWTALLDGSGWVTLRIATDALALVLGGALALALSTAGAAPGPWPLALFVALALLGLDSSGRYRQRMRDAVGGSAASAIGAISTSAVAVLALMLVADADPALAAPVVAWTWLLGLGGVTLTASALIALQRALRRRGIVERATLVVGADATGLAMATRMRSLPEYGLRPVGFLDPDPSRALPDDAPALLGGLDDLAAVVAAHDVRTVVLCFPDVAAHEALELVTRCDALGLDTTIVPRLSAAVNFQTRFEYLGVQPLLNLRAVDRDGWRFELKHALDRVIAAIALVALAPLLATIAALVRASSRGPILFRQQRTGHDGAVFELLKFRTMVEPDDAGVYEMYPELAPRGIAPGGVEGIDRRTPIGRLLRRSSLDELPQLVNVLRGEMSIVGPRPERPEFAELFRGEVERYRERQRVRAGLTGWAQVHGSRGQTPLAERVELDNFYIEHWSLGLDAKIMLLTLPALLRGS